MPPNEKMKNWWKVHLCCKSCIHFWSFLLWSSYHIWSPILGPYGHYCDFTFLGDLRGPASCLYLKKVKIWPKVLVNCSLCIHPRSFLGQPTFVIWSPFLGLYPQIVRFWGFGVFRRPTAIQLVVLMKCQGGQAIMWLKYKTDCIKAQKYGVDLVLS